MEAPRVSYAGHLTGRRSDQPHFFEECLEHIRESLARLNKAFPSDGGRTVFDGLDALVVSSIGLIEDQSTLAQLSVWNEDIEGSTWTLRGRRVVGFDFKRIICDIVRDLSPTTNIRMLGKKIFVVNDVVACAAAEYSQSIRQGDVGEARELVYVKAHSGINVGVVEYGLRFTKVGQSNMGHFYPNYHPVDGRVRFRGTCPYHNSCLEGLISSRALIERTRPSERHRGPVPELAQVKKRLGAATEDVLLRELLNEPLTIDVIAHYLAQLAHLMMLSPAPPKRIVIGGRMATEAIIDGVRQELSMRLRGYPPVPGNMMIEKYLTAAATIDLKSPELAGALDIALARARQAPPDLKVVHLDSRDGA